MNGKHWSMILGLVLLAGCAEQDEVGVKSDVFGLKQGRFWVYRTTIVYPDDFTQVFDHEDSVWIEKDTVINGRTYWLQKGTLSGNYYLRDSSDCMIRRQLNQEQIIFSLNYKDTLEKYPPIYRLMTEVDRIVTTPAVSVRSSNCKTIIRIENGSDGHLHFPRFDDNHSTVQQIISSRGIGVVKTVEYYLDNTIIHELIRYGTAKP